MSPQPRRIRVPLPPALQPVADAAGEVLRAEVDEDPRLGELHAAAQTAIITALQAGHALPQIAEAEARGQEDERAKLRGELLKQIERATRRRQQAIEEQEAAIRRGDRAGLSSREMSAKADMTPATVRAVTGKPPALFDAGASGDDAAAAREDDAPADGEHDGDQGAGAHETHDATHGEQSHFGGD
jgi:hypothetical protein